MPCGSVVLPENPVRSQNWSLPGGVGAVPRYARMGPGVAKHGKGSAHPSCAQIGFGTLRGCGGHFLSLEEALRRVGCERDPTAEAVG